MKSNRAVGLLTTAVVLSLSSTSAWAVPASTLRDINGNPGSSAQNMLEQRGFKFISSHKNSMGYVYSYWWNGSDKNCVQTEVYNGMVETISDAKNSDCNHSDGNAAVAVGAVAGLAILGAVLASKSHHHKDRNYDNQHLAQFDRGYKDGLHNAAYHNYGRSTAYTDGYQAGVDERNANLSHHYGHGGYHQMAQYKDLQGARAAGAMEEFSRRGFRQVDNFASGNTRYSVQWRAASRQCLQATITDGRIYDVRDIQTHPNCRG